MLMYKIHLLNNYLVHVLINCVTTDPKTPPTKPPAAPRTAPPTHQVAVPISGKTTVPPEHPT
jgi:hypothetical protein